jgi:hypothetical protein
MSSTWLERARANQEDIEAYEKGIVQQLEDKPKKVSSSIEICLKRKTSFIS